MFFLKVHDIFYSVNKTWLENRRDFVKEIHRTEWLEFSIEICQFSGGVLLKAHCQSAGLWTPGVSQNTDTQHLTTVTRWWQLKHILFSPRTLGT